MNGSMKSVVTPSSFRLRPGICERRRQDNALFKLKMESTSVRESDSHIRSKQDTWLVNTREKVSDEM
jgi:hypothetical protein